MKKYLFIVLLVGFWSCEDEKVETDNEIKFQLVNGLWISDSIYTITNNDTLGMQPTTGATPMLLISDTLFNSIWFMNYSDTCYNIDSTNKIDSWVRIDSSNYYLFDILNDDTLGFNRFEFYTDDKMYQWDDNPYERRIHYVRIPLQDFDPMCED